MPTFVPDKPTVKGGVGGGTFVPLPIVGAAPRGKGKGGKGGGGKKGGGFWHDAFRYSGAELVDNLGKDVGSTAVGLAPGFYETGKQLLNPTYQGFVHGFTSSQATRARAQQSRYFVNTAKALGKSYADTYGPIAHGDFSHVYDHPLGPILDAATILDLGATAGVRLGMLGARGAEAARGAELVTRSPKAIFQEKGPVQTELAAEKPLRRAVQRAQVRARANPRVAPVQRYRAAMAGEKVELQPLGEYKAYGAGIKGRAEQRALRRSLPGHEYDRRFSRLSGDEKSALHIRSFGVHPADLAEVWHGTPNYQELARPGVLKNVFEPSKRLLKAESEAQKLSKSMERLYTRTGRLKAESVEMRPLAKREAVSGLLDRPARKLPGGPEPYYVPDTLSQQVLRSPMRAVGGKGVPKELGSVKANQNRLFLAGKLHLRGDILGPEMAKRVKLLKFDETHNALKRGAVQLTRQEIEDHFGGLPKGWEYLHVKPQYAINELGKRLRVAGGPIPPLMKREGEGAMSALLHSEEPGAEGLLAHEMTDEQLGQHLSTTDINKAYVGAGQRYHLVPSEMVKAATGEFTRSSALQRALVTKPLQLWRSAVLGLRVGFLTNNVVGNSLMYAMKTGGKGAVRDLFGSMMEEHGARVAQRLINDPATPPELRPELQSMYDRFFPEHTKWGSLGGTQSPAVEAGLGRVTGTVGRNWNALTRALPEVSSKSEVMFRRALIRNAIRRSPEFKKLWGDMPRQTRTFEEAASRILQGKGGAAYQRLVSEQINDALGDYLHLSGVESGVRQLLPFYAWYRAILRATYTLARDTPLRANIIAHLGQIGKQYAAQDVPSWLEGSIPMGPGRRGTERILSTQGLNPYATLAQFPQSFQDVNALGANPFFVGPIEAAAHLPRGKPLSTPWLVGQTLGNIVRNLPLSTLVAPQKPSQLYPTRDRPLTALSYLGIPVKEYNPAVARAKKQAGQ